MGQTTFTTSFVSGTGDNGSGSGNGTLTTGQPMGQTRRVEPRSRKRRPEKKERKARTSDQYGLAGGQENRVRGERTGWVSLPS